MLERGEYDQSTLYAYMRNYNETYFKTLQGIFLKGEWKG
jgi:hypothetical protein